MIHKPRGRGNFDHRASSPHVSTQREIRVSGRDRNGADAPIARRSPVVPRHTLTFRRSTALARSVPFRAPNEISVSPEPLGHHDPKVTGSSPISGMKYRQIGPFRKLLTGAEHADP